MKDNFVATNTFRSGDPELLRKIVTEKIEKIVNLEAKKQAGTSPVKH